MADTADAHVTAEARSVSEAEAAAARMLPSPTNLQEAIVSGEAAGLDAVHPDDAQQNIPVQQLRLSTPGPAGKMRTGRIGAAGFVDPNMAQNDDWEPPIFNPKVKGLQIEQLIGHPRYFICEDCPVDPKRNVKPFFKEKAKYEEHLRACQNREERVRREISTATAAATVQALIAHGVISVPKAPTHETPTTGAAPEPKAGNSETASPVVQPRTPTAGPEPKRRMGRPPKSLAR